MKRQTLRSLVTNTRQAFELGDEARERFGEIGHRLEHAGRKAHAAKHAAHLTFDVVLDLL